MLLKMRILLAASFIFLYSLRCECSLPNGDFSTLPTLTEVDKETIKELKDWRIDKSYYLLKERNVTSYAMAKSIVDHNIAGNKTLRWAKVIIEYWDPESQLISEQDLSNLPDGTNHMFEQFYDTYTSERRRRKAQFNTWTNGEYQIIFRAYHNKISSIHNEFLDLMKKSVNKLSDNITTFFRPLIEEANSPDRDQALSSYGRLYELLVNNL